ncbi:Uncharacterised protein [Vibrio cholerae]|nr:Uncharacterised protein [Vibrio cholerae]
MFPLSCDFAQAKQSKRCCPALHLAYLIPNPLRTATQTMPPWRVATLRDKDWTVR